MKTTNDLPVDPLGNLGAPIRPTAAPAPDPVKTFEQQRDRPLIGSTSTAIETITETLRKNSGVVVSDGQEADWEGLCLDAYSMRLLGCI